MYERQHHRWKSGCLTGHQFNTSAGIKPNQRYNKSSKKGQYSAMPESRVRDMRSAQMVDEDLNAILKAMEKDERPTWEEISRESPITKAYWAQWQTLIVEDGCLWRIWHSADASWAKTLLKVI
uniref:Uncharacterized protein n=1 Tax=Glossina austeni TaxID=7395 RepID=A0A1A9VX50_GLOAU